MKKIIFGIFAHPDDEAFGPCGTLIKEVKDGTELHLFTLTSGEAGQNPDNFPDLGAVRDAEWRKASKLIGAFGKYNMMLRDGRLNNVTMQLASERIMQIVRDIITSHAIPVEAEFITFEPLGLTGHIDHIVAARAASFAFYRLKNEGLPLTRIRYYCNDEKIAPVHNTDWIYADKGHADHEIDEVVDARHLQKEIIAIMKTHDSQRADCTHYLEIQGPELGLDHFIVKT
jgi:LmbE family N-acetylglucosaminyl deacetylase